MKRYDGAGLIHLEYASAVGTGVRADGGCAIKKAVRALNEASNRIQAVRPSKDVQQLVWVDGRGGRRMQRHPGTRQTTEQEHGYQGNRAHEGMAPGWPMSTCARSGQHGPPTSRGGRVQPAVPPQPR